jgi:transcriptional regulator with XRE-family HTH domain
MNSDYKDFGMLIRNARKQQRLTQTELAEKVGVHRRTISSYENGQIYPHPATLRTLGIVLKLPESTATNTGTVEEITTPAVTMVLGLIYQLLGVVLTTGLNQRSSLKQLLTKINQNL